MVDLHGTGVVYPVIGAALVVAGVSALLLFLMGVRRYEIAVWLVLGSAFMHFGAVGNVDTGLEDMLASAEAAGPAKLLRIGMILMAGAMGAMLWLRHWRAGGRTPFPLLLLGLFLAHAATSVLYSIEPRFTLIRSAEFVAFGAFLAGVTAWARDMRDLHRLLGIFFLFFAAVILINAASALIAPGKAWFWRASNRFQGLTGHPNTMGAVCMSAYLVFLWQYGRARAGLRAAILLMLMLALGMHVLSGSRASMMAAATGFLAWNVARREWRKVAVFAACAVMGLFFVRALPSLLPSFQREFDGVRIGRVTDLTGRTDMWRPAVHLFLRNPVLGYGYEVSGSVWNEADVEDAFVGKWGSSKTSLHNGYLDVAIGSGGVGIVLWLAILLSPLPRLRRAPFSDTRALALGYLAQFLLLNCFESAVTTSRSLSSLAFWFVWVVAVMVPRLEAREADAKPMEEESRVATG